MKLIFGVVGLLVISIAIWIKEEKKQNILFIIGGILLLVYSLYIRDWIFVTLQIIFTLSAFIEIIKRDR
jgi:sulfite exporter TauE/SafE